MTNCSSPALPVADSVTDDGAGVAELAAVWAVLNVVEAEAADRDDEVGEIRRGFNQVLAEHELRPADLFEYIAEHLEQGDWRALGLPNVEPEVADALMGRVNNTDQCAVPNQECGGWPNSGGGEIRIANQRGRLIDPDPLSGRQHAESPPRDHH